MRSLAYGSRLRNRALGCGVCIYTYPGGTPSVSELWVLSQSSGAAGGVPGLGGAGHGRGAPVPLHLKRVCEFFAVTFWQGRQPSVWLSRTIPGCISISAFTLSCPGNTTPCFLSAWTLVGGCLIRCCALSIAARENPPLAILAIFKAWRMLDWSSCNRPPCLAIVADRLKTFNKLVAASEVWFSCYLNHIQLRSLL